jgi:predicted aldo/keto reductase-like oxidoreductase
MQYRKFGKVNEQVSALGFGCMRLPVLNNGSINEEEAIAQIRHAIDNGVNYIDTAYGYHEGKSEILVGKALKDGYREKVYLADKNPVWLVKEYNDFSRLLNEQLEKLQTDHIDFYLMHAMNKERWENIKSLNVFKFIEEAKADGRIKYAGFSFHDKQEVFMDIIDGYDWDFCQIQYNYMDEYNQAGVAGLKRAAEKGMAVVIMEPLLGGKLANVPPKEVAELWNSSGINRTPAEWALRWLWNQPEVTVILSGMNSIAMIDENMKTASTALVNSMSEEELAVVDKVKAKYKELTRVNCTACRYCMPCPAGVDIPRNFAIYNQAAVYNDWKNCSSGYSRLEEKQKAAACVECGKCEKVCPQALTIREYLKDVHSNLVQV